jgi:hypothetical protein
MKQTISIGTIGYRSKKKGESGKGFDFLVFEAGMVPVSLQ